MLIYHLIYYYNIEKIYLIVIRSTTNPQFNQVDPLNHELVSSPIQ